MLSSGDKALRRRLWGRLLAAVLLGAGVGAAAGFFWTRPFVARALLRFPEVNLALYTRLSGALAADPMQLDSAPAGSSAPVSTDTARRAAQILATRAAARYALQQPNARNFNAPGEAAVGALLQGLRCEVREPDSLLVELSAADAEAARSRLESLLTYYTTFVAQHPVSTLARARAAVAARRKELAGQLAAQEARLSSGSLSNWRKMGDALVKPKAGTMAQLWRKRVNEQLHGEEVLNQLHQMRQPRDNPAGKPQTASAEKWSAQWRLAAPYDKHDLFVVGGLRPQELADRVALERNYENALAADRALALQAAFLETWSALESPDFEVLDPIYVQLASPGRALALGTASGALLGLLLGLLGLAVRPVQSSRVSPFGREEGAVSGSAPAAVERSSWRQAAAGSPPPPTRGEE